MQTKVAGERDEKINKEKLSHIPDVSFDEGQGDLYSDLPAYNPWLPGKLLSTYIIVWQTGFCGYQRVDELLRVCIACEG